MLKDLLEGLDYQCLQGQLDCKIDDICIDSSQVKKNDLFVCIKGSQYNSHDYIDEIVSKGCKCIVVSEDVKLIEGITYIYVSDSKEAFAYICNHYFHHPSKEMIMIGITGTKGKTTLAHMLYDVIEKDVGMIGTMGIYYHHHIKTNNTTPDAYTINKYLREMLNLGYRYCIMEVSSLGIFHKRIAGLEFDIGILTNISEDHIGNNEHPSYLHYKQCKYEFLKQCKKVILNKDDHSYYEIIKFINHYYTYSIDRNSELMATNIKPYKNNQELGIAFDSNGIIKHSFYMNIPGLFNVYNALALLYVCKILAIEYKKNINVYIKGRCECLCCHQDFVVMIDYAHNLLSYRCLLDMVKEYQFKHIYAVYGAGGNRDVKRRYDIGKLVASYGVFSVVTMDNPRYENVDDICDCIVSGIKDGGGEYVVLIDRKSAIEYVLNRARSGDIVLLIGKGGEDYQLIEGKKYRFDEREVVFGYLKRE